MKRVKRRYLALQLECEAMPAEREFIDAVWAAVTKLYGEVGASLTGLALIDFDVERKVAVLRVSLAALNMAEGFFGYNYQHCWQGDFGACFGCFRHA